MERLSLQQRDRDSCFYALSHLGITTCQYCPVKLVCNKSPEYNPQ